MANDKLSYEFVLNSIDNKYLERNNNPSYKELIHKLFLSKQLNYKYLYKDTISQENKYTSDIILSILQVTLESTGKTDFLFKNLVSLYKNQDYLTNSNIHFNKSEIKILKFIKYEKLIKGVG